MIANEATASQRSKLRKLVKRFVTDNVFDRIQKALERTEEKQKDATAYSPAVFTNGLSK